jgi:hypothetical protein
MSINPKSLENLTPYSASDGAKDLVKVSIRLTPDAIAGLDKLPGDRSVHVRKAVDQYLKKLISNTP